MSFLRKRRFATLATLLALIGSCYNTCSFAQESNVKLTAPKLFPEKTLLYLRVDDVAELKKDLERSSLGKLAADDQIRPILSEFYGSLVQTTEQMQEAIGLNLDELLSIPTGEMAIALLPGGSAAKIERRRARENKSENNEGEAREEVSVRVNRPIVAALLDAGDEISSIKVLLARIEEAAENLIHEEKAIDRLTLHRYRNPERSREQFAYFIDDGVIVACTDVGYAELLAEKWLGQLEDAETLAENKKFTSIMSRCVGTEGERPQVSFYVDPLAMVREFVPRNAGTTMGLAMIPALGFDGIEAVGGSWIIAPPDFDAINHMHLQLASPRKAVLGLLRPKSGSTDPENWVPDSVAAYSTINWDISSTIQGIERLYNMFRGDDAFNEQVVNRLSELLELEFRKDVLDNLEGRLTFLQGFVRPVTINSGSNVYAIRLNNVEFFKSKVMPKLMAKIEERTELPTKRFGNLNVRVLKIGRSVNEEVVRQPEICFTTIDDYLVISDSQYMIRKLVDCIEGRVGPLSEALEYQLISDRIAAQLQDKECAAITFSRPEESLELFYELARDPKNIERLRSLSEDNPFFKSLLNALEKNKLPPFSVISQYLAPSGGFVVEEESGMHYMTFTLRRD